MEVKETPELIEARQILEGLVVEYLAKEQALLNKLTKGQRQAIGKPIKNITYLDQFTANGTEYFIRQSLTIERFEQFEKLQVKVGYGVDFRQMFDNLLKSYTYLNDSQPADAAIVLHNMMNGVKNELEGRENEVLYLCALFICREDEDLTKYDPVLIKAKIEDWKEEGIAMESFFTIAFNLVNGFMPVYNQVSQSISDHVDKVQDVIRKSKSQRKSSSKSTRTK